MTDEFRIVLKYDQMDQNVFNEIVFNKFILNLTKYKNHDK